MAHKAQVLLKIAMAARDAWQGETVRWSVGHSTQGANSQGVTADELGVLGRVGRETGPGVPCRKLVRNNVLSASNWCSGLTGNLSSSSKCCVFSKTELGSVPMRALGHLRSEYNRVQLGDINHDNH